LFKKICVHLSNLRLNKNIALRAGLIWFFWLSWINHFNQNNHCLKKSVFIRAICGWIKTSHWRAGLIWLIWFFWLSWINHFNQNNHCLKKSVSIWAICGWIKTSHCRAGLSWFIWFIWFICFSWFNHFQLLMKKERFFGLREKNHQREWFSQIICLPLPCHVRFCLFWIAALR